MLHSSKQNKYHNKSASQKLIMLVSLSNKVTKNTSQQISNK